MFRPATIGCVAVLAFSTLSWSAGPEGRDEIAGNREKDKTAEVTLGIASLSFSGDMEKPEGGPAIYRFSSEPRIKKVDPAGPAVGILRDGDVIVAIDGYLITTKEGGLRFGRLVKGKPVALTIRRWGSEKDVVVVPEIAPQRRASKESASPAASAPEATEGQEPGRPPGWLGLFLSCRGMTIKTGKGHVEWRFEDLPRVYSVDSNGPGQRSGILPGDLLVTLDGLRLDTEEGSHRFSSIEPGQELLWTVRRAGQEMTIRMRAETGSGSQPDEQQ